MIRNLLILLLFLGVGLGANVAESDIFVRQSPKQEKSNANANKQSEKKSSIYLRSQKKKGRSSARNMFETRLNTEGLRRQAVQDLKMLAYWQQSGRKPETLDELHAYSVAMRAENLASVIKQRNEILPSLMKAQRERFQRVAEQNAIQTYDREAAIAASAQMMIDMGYTNVPVKVTRQSFTAENTVKTRSAAVKQKERGVRRSVNRVTPIFRRQDNDNKQASGPASRVYQNYR